MESVNKHSPFSLDGKTILVTGASSGIGRSIAVESSKMGAKLLISGRNMERLQETCSLLSGTGHRMIIGDLTKESDLREIVESLTVLDGVVNSAGIINVLPFRFLNKEKLDKVLQVNLYSPILLIQAILEKRVLSEGASIIFISSLSGTRKAILGNSAYSASKSAICGLAKNLALELAPKKIRVNTVLPGMIETPILSNGPVSVEDMKKNISRYPLGRYGKPEEVAYLCVYLLSDASNWMTGSELLLDGGFTL